MTKCPDCPAEGPCVVQWTAHAAFCEWARAGGARRARVIELSADPPSGVPDAPSAPRPAVAGAVALVQAMKSCPFRATGAGCGCEARCALRRGAAVAHVECFECLRAYPDP